MAGSPLPRPVERVLAKRETECLVSTVTGWEIIMKAKLGVSAADIEAAIGEMGAALLPIKFKHLNELSHLPSYEDHRDPFDRMLIVQSLGTGGVRASIIGTGIKSHTRFAAFANGVSIHADDFDDTQLAAAKDRIYGLLTHPTIAVLPPAFALCELGKRTGKDLMLAYHVGVEVECKIAEAIAPRHYDEGFHTTGTCGTFGSAAACAKLRGLNALQTTYTLGIAATEGGDRKSTRLNSSHLGISYAVFCL